ncbi:hypothetical protein [Brevibacterium renqingii]|uniref:hypothetical protein n=1 Tax=Brevibacterium renqingii TaxID=2776916 RepID=UPI001FE6308C|nr:hypothetical protein [Brevibacterium renqingii]
MAQAVLFETEEKFARMDAFLSKREAKKAKKAAESAAQTGRTTDRTAGTDPEKGDIA